MRCNVETFTFSELKKWTEALSDQQRGRSGPISDAGEPYVELYEHSLARPEDTSIAEAFVAKAMWNSIRRYLNGKEGRVYWSVPLEWELYDCGVTLWYDEHGNDFDFVENRKCVKSNGWVDVKVYCRLARGEQKIADAA